MDCKDWAVCFGPIGVAPELHRSYIMEVSDDGEWPGTRWEGEFEAEVDGVEEVGEEWEEEEEDGGGG